MLTPQKFSLIGLLAVAMTQSVLAIECTTEQARGAQVFANDCGVCHSVNKGVTGFMGPNLSGVFGRKAAAQEGFNYSQAMRSKDISWQAENIAHLIEQPQAFMPGTYMPYAGMASAADRQAVVCYLKAQQ
jgi:cytochrome c